MTSLLLLCPPLATSEPFHLCSAPPASTPLQLQSMLVQLTQLHRTHSQCHNPQCSGACRTYFPQPWTRCVDPGSILAEQRTMLDEATKVGMRNTDTHICAPSLFSSQCVYIYPTSTGNFPSLEIN